LPYDNEDEAELAVACSETDNPRRPRRWSQAARLADREAPHFGALWTFLSQACATWPAHDADRYAGPFDRPTAGRVLIVGAVRDPLVPYTGVQRVARELPGARLLTLDSAGHLETNVGSACVRAAVERYFVDGVLPPADAVCAPDAQPFEPAASTLAGAAGWDDRR
jgi:pimeloyl-ACP methyl ester carboxylesterase